MTKDQKIDDPATWALTSPHETKALRDMTDEEVELMARKNHYAEVLKWQGKLYWDDQPAPQDAVDKLDATRVVA